jgi:cobalt/nickel transport system permease protein
MVILVSTTSFPSLINALEKMRVPKLFITLLGFVYRYSFLFIDEFESLERTYKSRTIGRSFKLKKSAVSNIAATLFRISLEKSDKVHQAMLSRGFTGTFRSVTAEKISFGQIFILIVFIILFIGVRIIV